MNQDIIIAILAIIIPALVTGLGIIIAWQTEKLRTMREQLSEKKCIAYADTVKMFYSILKDIKSNKHTNNNAAMQKMIDMKRDIFMYGSDKVFKAFNAWLLTTSNTDTKAQLSAFLDFVLEMRRELYNNKTELTKEDILINLTQSKEEAQKLF
ncbi:MAG: hypothetical protein Q4D41_11585 [Prevotellaceae bacterium]|nr:hypothetical protein [Prevotellaceae bacterium]